MSFGFSVGDFLAGATLAYKVYQALLQIKGASGDYQRLTADLLGVHKVLLHVGELQASNQLSQSTLNALLFLTTGINEAMESFMLELDLYKESLQSDGSGSFLRDIFLKGKWTTRMPDEAHKLHDTLQTNLISLSILVQLACYFNTGYDPRLSATLNPCPPIEHLTGFPEIKTNALISSEMTSSTSPEFRMASQFARFFRPGQVFSVEMRSQLDKNSRSGHPIQWLKLELDSPAKLRENQRIRDFGRQERLKQILQLPLAKMFQYATLEADGKLSCNLCERTDRNFTKEEWVADHFRRKHIKLYRSLATTISQDNHANKIIPLCLDDINETGPLLSDEHLFEMYQRYGFLSDFEPPRSYWYDPWAGAIMICRFVVVQQGVSSSLCLGIHTYAGTGCSYQTNQDPFAILHSSKDVPPPLEKETGMHLKPIRLKADHPSTTLPSTARIHFGHIYEVKHDVKVKSIGLIHDASMETLLSQFRSYIRRENGTEERLPAGGPSQEATIDSTVYPADINVVREIRDNVHTILGRDSLLERTPSRDFSVETPSKAASQSSGSWMPNRKAFFSNLLFKRGGE